MADKELASMMPKLLPGLWGRRKWSVSLREGEWTVQIMVEYRDGGWWGGESAKAPEVEGLRENRELIVNLANKVVGKVEEQIEGEYAPQVKDLAGDY